MPFQPSESELAQFLQHRREQAQKRQKMKKALGKTMTPLLRRHGFVGNCPHFRRIRQERFDLLMLCFNKHDDSFSIDIGQCPSDWFPKPGSRIVPPEKLTTWDLPSTMRTRVQPRSGPSTADCFQYGDANSPEDFQRIAESVVPFMERAVEMFDDVLPRLWSPNRPTPAG
jgi:hypothetical protein